MKRIISIFLVLVVLSLTLSLGSITAMAEEPDAPIVMKIDGFGTRKVLSFEYGFNQPIDIEGQPAGIPRATTFVIRVPGTVDGNTELFGWMVAGITLPKNVSLIFTNPTDGKESKVINLTNAYCARYTEYWDQDGTYYEEIEVVAESFQNGGASYERSWK